MATLADMTGTAVAIREPAPLLPMEPEQAAAMMQRYRALCESILTSDDVIGIPGQPGGFIKRSGFSKLATYYGVSTEILTQSMTRDGDDLPRRAAACVRATAINGRFADGDGACAITEPRFKNESGRQKAEHDVMATAVTRATNRAISNLIGFGSVSAEEADDEAGAQLYGAPATVAQEDGMLRALEDLGADAAPAKRLIERCGYLPKIAALTIMWAAVSMKEVADRGQVIDAEPVEADASDAIADEIKQAFDATEPGDDDPHDASGNVQVAVEPKPKSKPRAKRRYGQPPEPVDATNGESPTSESDKGE